MTVAKNPIALWLLSAALVAPLWGCSRQRADAPTVPPPAGQQRAPQSATRGQKPEQPGPGVFISEAMTVSVAGWMPADRVRTLDGKNESVVKAGEGMKLLVFRTRFTVKDDRTGVDPSQELRLCKGNTQYKPIGAFTVSIPADGVGTLSTVGANQGMPVDIVFEVPKSLSGADLTLDAVEDTPQKVGNIRKLSGEEVTGPPQLTR